MKLLGFTEEVTTCDCCGKSELKGTFAFQTESGIRYFGSDCSRKYGYNGTSIRKDATKAKKERDAKMRSEILEATSGLWDRYYEINDWSTPESEEIRNEIHRIKSEIESKYKIAA